jgi:hypothetical protein
MQNRYVGDTGDFVKYLLLKNLCTDNLRLGVNWCLVEDESHNNDGKFITYLESENHDFLKVDGGLFTELKGLVASSKRSVDAVQESDILPLQTSYFSEKVPQGTNRFPWHDSSLKKLAACDIIFYDPDNGLEVKSFGKLHPNAIKHIFFDEIRDTYRAGKSIIIYQHTDRSAVARGQINTRVQQLKDCLPITDSRIEVLYSGQGTARFFIIIKQDSHAKIIDDRLKFIDKMALNSNLLCDYKKLKEA